VQSAIITGATGALGRALVKEFAGAGWFTGIACRSEPQAAAELLEGIRAAGGSGIVLQGDLAAPGTADRIAAEFLAAAGSIDALINNAGDNIDKLFYFSTEADWRAMIDANLMTALFTTRAILPEMVRRRAGSIVNISSVSGLEGLKGHSFYGASKAALHGFTRSLAREVGRLGIRVNALAVGAIESPATDGLPQEQKQYLAKSACLERMGRPEEAAACARFLASEGSSFITAQIIAVDGGVA